MQIKRKSSILWKTMKYYIIFFKFHITTTPIKQVLIRCRFLLQREITPNWFICRSSFLRQRNLKSDIPCMLFDWIRSSDVWLKRAIDLDTLKCIVDAVHYKRSYQIHFNIFGIFSRFRHTPDKRACLKTWTTDHWEIWRCPNGAPQKYNIVSV